MSIMLRLEVPARIFRHAYGPDCPLLSWDRRTIFDAGSIVPIGEPVKRSYDHWDKVAIPLGIEGDKALILFEELSRKNQKDVKSFFPDCELLVTVH